MGLLKLLGIEKYLKKVKTYVDEKAQELNERINNIKTGEGDETLMKYLANPYAIRPGVQIPEDLHNLIYEGGAGLKPVVMSACVFYEDAESRVYRIEAATDWEIYVYGGQQMSYNDLDRVFDY